MDIINTFPYSEPHELEILLMKFYLEDKGVSEWIICENDYTFRNDYKGYTLKKIINEDPRFKRFSDRITVVEESFSRGVSDVYDDFSIGNAQRNFGTQYILDKYKKDTWVIVSDVDEAFDFTGETEKTELIYKTLSEHEQTKNSIVFPRRRYWYDVDNYAFNLYHFPILHIEYLHDIKSVIGYKDEKRVLNIDTPVGYEYTFCYSLDHIIRKFETYGHIGYTKEGIIQSLRCNYWPVRGDSRPPSPDIRNDDGQPMWFETIELTPDIAPQYVIDNLERLKTNLIDPDYHENRKIDYPEYFGVK